MKLVMYNIILLWLNFWFERIILPWGVRRLSLKANIEYYFIRLRVCTVFILLYISTEVDRSWIKSYAFYLPNVFVVVVSLNILLYDIASAMGKECKDIFKHKLILLFSVSATWLIQNHKIYEFDA